MAEKDSAELALDEIIAEIESQSVALSRHFSKQEVDGYNTTKIIPQDPPKRVADQEDNSFSSVGNKNYLILSEIGRGGMGVVLKTRESSTGREEATKRSFAQSKDKGAVKRFILEALVTAHLCHPNIPPVYNMGVVESENVPFFTMLYVRGESLTDKIFSGKVNEEYKISKRLGDFRKISDGMDFAHSVGVIHRDLKPDNVMLGKHGEVLVMDWGLAKILNPEFSENFREIIGSQNTQLTMAGMAMGTPTYMPPEQASGRIDLIDQRADIYALGGILHFMLTGMPALDNKRFGGIQAMLAAIETGDIDIKEKIIGDKDLVNIVAKCLARRKEDRYSTVGELNEDIDAYLEGRMLSTGEYLRDASEVISRGGGYDSALKHITRAIKIDPTSPDAYFTKGQLHMEKAEAEEAIESFLKTNEIIKGRTKKQNPRALFYAGEATRRINEDFTRASEFYRQCAAASEEDNEFSLLSSAWLSLGNKQFKEAVDSLERILRFNKDFILAHELMGCIYGGFFSRETKKGIGKMGSIPPEFYNINKSINHFTRAIELSGKEKKGEYLVFRSFAFIKAGKEKKAEKDMHESLLLNPSLENIMSMVDVYQAFEKWESLLKFCESVEFIFGKETYLLYFNKGVAYDKLGQKEEDEEKRTDFFKKSIINFKKSIEFKPKKDDLPEIYKNLGFIKKTIGDFDEAIDNYKKALEIDSANYIVMNNIADIFYETENYNSAIEYCGKALEINPRFALGYLTRGMAYFDKWEKSKVREDIKSASKDIRKSLELKLEQEFIPFAHEWMGKIYLSVIEDSFASGKYNEVQTLIKRAEKLSLPSELDASLSVYRVEIEKRLKRLKEN